MVRVLYRWRIEDGRRDAFVEWWHQGTTEIRGNWPGAMGSTLMSDPSDPHHIAAIARWRSRDDVDAFWTAAANQLFEGAHLESIEVFDELDDLTVPSPEVTS
jgi:heme-degrading monooxygenase HmoA